MHLSFPYIETLFREWYEHGVKRIAIGGGEPMMHPQIGDIVDLANDLNLEATITTNGALLNYLRPSRVHVSWDLLHHDSMEGSRRSIVRALNWYSQYSDVGINHVVYDWESVLEALDLALSFPCEVTFLAPKHRRLEVPEEELIELQQKYPQTVWLDACISKCRQGRVSMSIDVEGKCHVCSNLFGNRILYTCLPKVWTELRNKDVLCARVFD